MVVCDDSGAKVLGPNSASCMFDSPNVELGLGVVVVVEVVVVVVVVEVTVVLGGMVVLAVVVGRLVELGETLKIAGTCVGDAANGWMLGRFGVVGALVVGIGEGLAVVGCVKRFDIVVLVVVDDGLGVVEVGATENVAAVGMTTGET